MSSDPDYAVQPLMVRYLAVFHCAFTTIDRYTRSGDNKASRILRLDGYCCSMSKRPLDQSVERTISAVMDGTPHLPSLTTFQKLSGGYANLVYELNGRYILRVFFRQGWEANFKAERVALEMIQSVPGVPRVLASGILPLEWPCPYLLLNKFPGTDAFGAWLDTSPDIRQIWAGEIAQILREAHALPPPAYGSISEDVDASNEVTPLSWQSVHDNKMAGLLATARQQTLTKDTLQIVDEAEEYYAAYRNALVYQSGPRLTHGDVRLHNIIVDDSHVTGIIDWEWAHGGEPEEDLINIIRFCLFPTHEASGVEIRAARAEYAPLVGMILQAYHELKKVPELAARLTIYLIEADLGQLVGPSEVLRCNAEERLIGWLRENLVERFVMLNTDD